MERSPHRHGNGRSSQLPESRPIAFLKFSQHKQLILQTACGEVVRHLPGVSRRRPFFINFVTRFGKLLLQQLNNLLKETDKMENVILEGGRGGGLGQLVEGVFDGHLREILICCSIRVASFFVGLGLRFGLFL